MGDFCIRLAYSWWKDLPSKDRTRARLLDILDSCCQSYAVNVTAELEARCWEQVPAWQRA